MYYMILRDTALHLYTDENCYKRSTLCTNTVQLQHALATKASDYTKKKHQKTSSEVKRSNTKVIEGVWLARLCEDRKRTRTTNWSVVVHWVTRLRGHKVKYERDVTR